MAKPKTCEKCHTPNLRWAQSRRGNWVLWNQDTPHYLECERIQQAMQNEIAHHEATHAPRLGSQLGTLNGAPVYDGQEIDLENQDDAETAIALGGLNIEILNGMTDREISENRDLITTSLARSFAKTAVKMPPTQAHHTPASAPQTPTPERRTPRPAKHSPLSTQATEPRNIPCPKCTIPNRITYQELMRGVDCEHCRNK